MLCVFADSVQRQLQNGTYVCMHPCMHPDSPHTRARAHTHTHTHTHTVCKCMLCSFVDLVQRQLEDRFGAGVRRDLIESKTRAEAWGR